MIDLDYLKVGSYFVSHSVRIDAKHKNCTWQRQVWRVNTVKINKKSIVLNGIKYQISENAIYKTLSGYYETINPVTKEIQDFLNHSLDKELKRLEKNYNLVKELAKKAQDGDCWLSKNQTISFVSLQNDHFILDDNFLLDDE